MRKFLPIKGPGGRYLTPNEKVALLILGLTLVLCVLTLLAGESAYLSAPARNPIFSFVALLGRAAGAGIVAFYGLVLVWSGLIYFKGERIANVTPLGGRLFAATMVTIGVSGALGIAQLEAAGSLGTVVGAALDHTLGGGVGFPILLLLMLLGFHLAGQGAWTALREPMALQTASPAPPPHAAFGYGVEDATQARFPMESPLPDDGDPTADERSLAVTQAMEEIERSQGVTIVDVEPEVEERTSIGELVEAEPPPAPDTDEAEVRQGLAEVTSALDETDEDAEEEEQEEDAEEEDSYDSAAHGLVPVPADGEEEEEEEEYEEAEEEDEEDDEEYEDDEYEEGEEEEEAEDEEEEAADEEVEEDQEYEDEEEEEEVEEAPIAEAGTDAEEEEEPVAQADGFAETDDDDPYAQGGLLRRMQRQSSAVEESADDDHPYTTFDWRGRPLD